MGLWIESEGIMEEGNVNCNKKRKASILAEIEGGVNCKAMKFEVGSCSSSSSRNGFQFEGEETMTRPSSAFKKMEPSPAEMINMINLKLTINDTVKSPAFDQESEKDVILAACFKRQKVSPLLINAGGWIDKGKRELGYMSEVKNYCSSSSSSRRMNRRPYEKLASSRKAERGWLETALRMGVMCPEFYLSKKVTQSDAKPDQNRLQLTQTDIGKASSSCLRNLAEKARKTPPPNGVPVKVMDRMGSEYDMTFKYIVSSTTYRFMGAGYAKFLIETGLRANQIMDIWGLPISDHSGRRGNQGDHWLAFVQQDEGILGSSTVGDGEGDDELIVAEALLLLKYGL